MNLVSDVDSGWGIVMVLTISCQTENEQCEERLHDAQGSCEGAVLVERHADLILRCPMELVQL